MTKKAGDAMRFGTVVGLLGFSLMGALVAGCGDKAAVPGSALPAMLAGARAADAGAGTIPLKGPIGLAESPAGELYVGNSTTSQILVYDSRNRQVTSKTISEHVDNPAGLAFDQKGNLYVADAGSHEVTVYSTSEELKKTIRTTKSHGYFPSGVQIDPAGNLWVASRASGNYGIGEIQVFSSSGKLVTTIKTNLEYPVGIVFFNDHAWVCDSTTPQGNAFSVFALDGTFLERIQTPGFTPTYAAVHGQSLYTTDGIAGSVAVVDAAGSITKTTANKGLNYPYGIAFTKTGNYYVADVGNSTITEYNANGKLVATIK